MQIAKTEHGMTFTLSNGHEIYPFINTQGASLQPTVGMRPVSTEKLPICTTLER
jgi:hypothetical protein